MHNIIFFCTLSLSFIILIILLTIIILIILIVLEHLDHLNNIAGPKEQRPKCTPTLQAPINTISENMI